jgi:hypothetical protein
MGYSKQAQRTIDESLTLKASGAVTADADHTIIDLGSDAAFKGEMLIDVSAIDIADTDETYQLILMGSASATLASGIVHLASITVGDAATIANQGDVDSTTGRYIVPFSNILNDVAYRYVRLSTDVTGTSPSITFSAYAVKG